MAQVTFAADTTPSLVDLDANFNELYSKTAYATTGIGYATGAGGTVTQATSKSTAVTLNKMCGKVTVNGAALAAGATVQFLLNNTNITVNDCVVLTQDEAVVTGLNYNIWPSVGGNYVRVNIKNISAGSLSDAFSFNFTVIKSVTS